MDDHDSSSYGMYYTLQNDIDASVTAGWNSGAGFDPIGEAGFGGGFAGVFNGNGKVIRNLTIHRPSESYVGLFGFVGNSGVVKNLGLAGGSVTGAGHVGGLIGLTEGTVSNCYATAAVTGSEDGEGSVGGLTGAISGTASGCYATGTVTGSSSVGGLTGDSSGTVNGCYATGTVIGNHSFVGGLIGLTEGTVSNCYATGAVTGHGNDVGGLMGHNGGGIDRCYATGAVTGDGGNIGGIWGSNYGNVGGLVGSNQGTVRRCYATGAVISNDDCVGGLVGYNTDVAQVAEGMVIDCYATGSVMVSATVSGNWYVGGLLGDNDGTVINCYATGVVMAYECQCVGSLVGYNYTGKVINSFWDTEASGQTTSDGGTGLNTVAMKKQATFTGWDFTNAWYITENVTYPLLHLIPSATRVIGVSGNLAFGNVPTGQTATAAMMIINNGDATLTVAYIDYPAGFTGAWSGTIVAGGSHVVTVSFIPMEVTAYGGVVTVNTDKTSGGNTISVSGTGTGWVNQPPVITKGSPVADPAAVNEGATVAFSVTANDITDTNAAGRGMSNIVWYVDGVLKQVTKTGAPNAITSAFTFKTDAATVQGEVFKDVAVGAVALDKLGGTTETNWTVRVNNVPAAQTVTFPALPVKALGDPDFVPGAAASSGLPVTCVSSNPAVAQIVGGLVRIVGAGTAVITASQPGNFDFKAATLVKQTLTVKARLTAEVPSCGGAVTGAGLYLPGAKVALSAKPNTGYTLLRWQDGSQAVSRSLLMPNDNTTVSAWFGITTNVPKPEIVDPEPQQAMVGVPFSLPLDITSESLPTVSVSGLPSGLAYVPASKSVAGVPTASVTNRIVTITAKNVNKISAVGTFTMTVDPLPIWAQGAFNGAAGTDALGSGGASMSVTSVGGVSGKFTLRGTNFTFNSKAYSSRGCDGSFTLVTTATVGKVAWPLTVSVNVPEITDTTGTVPQTLSKAEGVLSGNGWTTLYRNIWKDAGMVTVLTNRFTGYYTAVLPGGSEYGSGYLAFTVDKAGGVKTTGKLADGTPVSLAGTLILDEAGRAFMVLYTSPTAYKGGCIFGLAEFFLPSEDTKVVVRLLDGEPFVWESLNPAATQVYGAGFSRELGLTGGWYDTAGNLYRYYAGKDLAVSTEGAPVPEFLVGTNRYDSVWWDPDGIALAVVTNSLGVMTGLAAPKSGLPVKAGSGNVYDYATGTNTLGLTVGLTRATGVFKGSLKAWFDYAATHTPKLISYEGVLTPEREDKADGVAGRGFFLWADKSQYLNPLNKPVPYSFSWSYDLKIMLSE